MGGLWTFHRALSQGKLLIPSLETCEAGSSAQPPHFTQALSLLISDCSQCVARLSFLATLKLRFNFILLKSAEEWLWTVCQPSVPAAVVPHSSRVLLYCQRLGWRLCFPASLSNSHPVSNYPTSTLNNSNAVTFCLPTFLCSSACSAAEVKTPSLPLAHLPLDLSWQGPREGTGPIPSSLKGYARKPVFLSTF